MGLKKVTNCESCSNYVYDEEYEYYVCEMDLDEDEMQKFAAGTYYDCPYYRSDDDYRIVRRQM
ncbi:MAG: DUF6472 family protein [Hominisplanchenecus sp.]|nr:DUF6472 family protein [Lachnospiraceae bacterium]